MKKNTFAMTLVELIIAIAISSIVLFFVVVYISDVLWLIWESRKSTSNFVELEKISDEINKFSYKFPVASINTSAGSEALILKNIQNNDWVVIGLIDAENKILTDSTQLGIYSQKHLAIRYLLSSELWSINTTQSFSWSTIFPDIYLKDIDFEIFDAWSGNIVEMDIDFINIFSSQRIGENLSNMNQQNFQNYNFSF